MLGYALPTVVFAGDGADEFNFVASDRAEELLRVEDEVTVVVKSLG